MAPKDQYNARYWLNFEEDVKDVKFNNIEDVNITSDKDSDNKGNGGKHSKHLFHF
jgi:hypothetical protein